MISEKWAWRIGIVEGIGECAYQVQEGLIRRLTVPVMQGGRRGFAKANIYALMDGDDRTIEFCLKASGHRPKKEIGEYLDSLWAVSSKSGLKIVQGSAGNFKG